MEYIKCDTPEDFKKIMLEKVNNDSNKKRFFTADLHFDDDRLN